MLAVFLTVGSLAVLNALMVDLHIAFRTYV